MANNYGNAGYNGPHNGPYGNAGYNEPNGPYGNHSGQPGYPGHQPYQDGIPVLQYGNGNYSGPQTQYGNAGQNQPSGPYGGAGFVGPIAGSGFGNAGYAPVPPIGPPGAAFVPGGGVTIHDDEHHGDHHHHDKHGKKDHDHHHGHHHDHHHFDH